MRACDWLPIALLLEHIWRLQRSRNEPFLESLSTKQHHSFRHLFDTITTCSERDLTAKANCCFDLRLFIDSNVQTRGRFCGGLMPRNKEVKIYQN